MLNDKKITCILPSINDNKFVTDFSKKSGLFNFFFSQNSAHLLKIAVVSIN